MSRFRVGTHAKRLEYTFLVNGLRSLPPQMPDGSQNKSAESGNCYALCFDA
jgi:hypothetical protein